MGSFSWCTSDTKKSIPSCKPFGDLPGTVYLLNPFGEPYKESDYEGYGEFGGKDVYELVAEWNRDSLTRDNLREPERSRYKDGPEGDASFAKAMELFEKKCEGIEAFAAGASDEVMREKYGNVFGFASGFDWKRCLGIDIACYDKEHVKLKYPIKIVEHPVLYDQAGISPSCPFQGCIYPDSMRDIRAGVRRAFERLEAEEAKWMEVQRQAKVDPAVKFRIVLTCWDYCKPEPYADIVTGFFPSEYAAREAVAKCVEDELRTLNDGRLPVPVRDSDGKIVNYDFDFRADENGDHANIIRFWDGDDYQNVTQYDIHPIRFMSLGDGSISKHSCYYRGFEILANSKHNRFKIEQYDTALAMKHSLGGALAWVDDLCLCIEKSKSSALKHAFAPANKLDIIIKNAELKTASAPKEPAPGIPEPTR